MRRRTIKRNRVRRHRMFAADRKWADEMQTIDPSLWRDPPRRWKSRLIWVPEGV